MTINVMIIDLARDFGGSIVSTANLIRGVDRSEFNVIFSSATNEELVKNKLREAAEHTEIKVLKKALNYGNMDKFLPYRNLENAGLRGKLLKYFSYFARLAANIPFMMRIAYNAIKHDVHIIQVNNGIDDEVCIAAKLINRKLVCYFRGYVALGNFQRKYIVDKIEYFFSVSEFVKNEAINDGIPSEKIIVATPPAITEEIDGQFIETVNSKYRKNADTTFIGIFGRITPWKGQLEFLEAANEALKLNKNMMFFIIGDVTDASQAYDQQVREKVKELSIEDNIVFTGYVENVYDYYELMDIILHMSVEPEPSGRVIFEAMSQGKVVIASDLGGPKEFVDHGKDGYIVDPKNAKEVARITHMLVENPSKRLELGANANKKMAALYNKDIYAKKVCEYYRKCIED